MAAYNKFESFVGDLAAKLHDLYGTSDADLLKCFLTNELPLAADTVKLDMAEIGAGNGYTAGGDDVQNDGSEAAGTFTLTGTKIVWTASGGTIGPFQYVVLYNDDVTSPIVDALIAWWDYGSALTLLDGETFTVKFNGGDPTGDIFTLV